jgi:hypothetical protein
MFGMTKQEWRWYKKNNFRELWHDLADNPAYDGFRPVPWWTRFGRKFFRIYLKLRFFIKKKPAINRIEYITTSKCTLNCASCLYFKAHFNPSAHYAPESLETFKSNIDKLLASVDFIWQFEILGGEPLLDKQLEDKIEYALSKKQIKFVFIITNCTILPSERLVGFMRNKKFGVSCSDYTKSPNSTVKLYFDEWVETVKNNGGNLQAFPDYYWVTTWVPRKPDEIKDGKTPLGRFDCCKSGGWRTYHSIIQGKLTSSCGGIPLWILTHWKDVELAGGGIDYVDIAGSEDAKTLTRAIIKSYAQPCPDYCKYCDQTDIGRKIPAALQAKRHGYGFSEADRLMDFEGEEKAAQLAREILDIVDGGK